MKKMIISMAIAIFSQPSFAITQSDKEKVMKLMFDGCLQNNSKSLCSCQYNYFQHNVPLTDFEDVAKGLVVLMKKPDLIKGAPKKTLWYLNELYQKCDN